MSAICPNPFCLNPDIDPFSPHGCLDKWTPPSTNSKPNSITSASPSRSSGGCLCSPDSCFGRCRWLTTGPSDERDTRPMISASASLAGKSSPQTTTLEEETPDLRPLVIHRDHRGNVREAFRSSWYPEVPPIVQVVHSESNVGVLRAMHAHAQQFDVWHFTQGKAQVQLYDHRDGFWSNLYVEPNTTLVIPPGISHGFLALTPVTLTYYLTREYDGTDEYEWNAWDPDFPGAREWSAAPAPITLGWAQEWFVQSDRDKNAPSLAQFVEAFPA